VRPFSIAEALDVAVPADIAEVVAGVLRPPIGVTLPRVGSKGQSEIVHLRLDAAAILTIPQGLHFAGI
jgi:hypothetical protein